ncbi:MAG TPA: hypothetical protein IAC25_00420 [Candidatus Enterenecus stercoripullorum]|nr:hypothetical protein [Candidatus Enterenecus stercoripullorum]
MDQETLRENLKTLDESSQFLIAIVASLLLSLRALLLQRGQVCAALAGETAPQRSVYPLRHTAGALTLGAVGFFLCLAARTLAQADPEDPAALCSARSGLAASVLVFAAAAIRLDDTEFLHCLGRM